MIFAVTKVCIVDFVVNLRSGRCLQVIKGSSCWKEGRCTDERRESLASNTIRLLFEGIMTFGMETNSKTKGEDVSLLDSSLTSLSWLQNLTVHDLISPTTVMTTLSPPNSCYLQSSPPCRSTKNVGVSLSPIKKCLLQSADFRRHPKKYRSNCDKPPFSYSTLIYLAIQQSKSGMATLNEIYRWIKENFKFYRCSEPGWQNSIRHNLSLNELFSKIPRAHGKGNHWGINPDYLDLFQDRKDNMLEHDRHHSGKLRSSRLKASYGRKRAHSQGELGSLHGKDTKRIRRKRRESEQKTSPSDVCGISGDLDWISLLGSQRNHSHQHDKATFTPPDLVVAGELCSPLTLPTAITAAVPVELPATPQVTLSHGALLEEVVLKQDSPSPQVVLPWAENGSQSPHCSAQTHPWAESRESTMHEVHNLFKMAKGVTTSCVWSPEHSWSSSTSCASATYLTRTPLLKGSS